MKTGLQASAESSERFLEKRDRLIASSCENPLDIQVIGDESFRLPDDLDVTALRALTRFFAKKPPKTLRSSGVRT